MNRPQQQELATLPWLQRIFLVAAGSGLVALFITAAWLEPDARGFGTHQRLGLPPCTFRQLTGIRCPSCGMTTSWSRLVRGQVARSFQANAGGAVLGITSLLLAPWALISRLRGKWLWRPMGEWTTVALVASLLAVTLIDWGIRCFLFR